MAIRYYDDAVAYKLARWIPENSNLRVLKPDESKKLFELKADDTNDKPMTLPFIALSRNNDINLILNIKNSRSFDGLKITGNIEQTALLNIIPIKIEYQMDIYTKTVEDGDEYLRTFLFKLINNPLIIIDIPYNGANIQHVAYIRILDTVSDTSSIPERLFSGQFTRWTIQMEIQDAFLFSIPYKKNWVLDGISLETLETTYKKTINIETIADKICLDVLEKKYEDLGKVTLNPNDFGTTVNILQETELDDKLIEKKLLDEEEIKK